METDDIKDIKRYCSYIEELCELLDKVIDLTMYLSEIADPHIVKTNLSMRNFIKDKLETDHQIYFEDSDPLMYSISGIVSEMDSFRVAIKNILNKEQE